MQSGIPGYIWACERGTQTGCMTGGIGICIGMSAAFAVLASIVAPVRVAAATAHMEALRILSSFLLRAERAIDRVHAEREDDLRKLLNDP
jgi:hypothetical protein